MNIWWKLGGVAVALVAAYFLVTMYGSVQYKRGKADERTVWVGEMLKAEKDNLRHYQNGVASVLNADKQYIETVREKIIPVTKTIVERATEYAQTADGSSICLTAERVFQLDEATDSLFFSAASSTFSDDGTLSSNNLGN